MSNRANTHSPASLYAADSCEEERRISESPSVDENDRDANSMDPSSNRGASPTGSVPSLHHPHHLPANQTTVEDNETSSSLAAKDFLPNNGSSLQTTLFNVILRSPSISVIFASDTPPAACSPSTALLQSAVPSSSPQHSSPSSATIEEKVRHDTPTVVWQGGGGASNSGPPQTPPGSNPTLASSRRSSVDAAVAFVDVPSDHDVPSVTPKHHAAVNTHHITRQQAAGSKVSVLAQQQQTTTTTTHASGGQWTPEPIPSQQQPPQFPAAAGRDRSGSSWHNSSSHTVDENLPTIRLSLQHPEPSEPAISPQNSCAEYADLDEHSVGVNMSQQPPLPTVENRRTSSTFRSHALHQEATMELPPPPAPLTLVEDVATMVSSSHIVASSSVSCFATTTTDNEEEPVFFGGDEGSIADEASPPRRCSASQRSSYWSQHFDDENNEVRREKENLHLRNDDDDNVIYLSQNSSRQARSSVSSRASDEGDDTGNIIEFAASTISIDEEDQPPFVADTTAVLPTLSSLLMDATEDDSDSWSDVRNDQDANSLQSFSTSRASLQPRKAEKEGMTSPSPSPLAPQLVGRAASVTMHAVAAGNSQASPAVVRVAQRSQEPVLRQVPSPKEKELVKKQQTHAPGPPAATRRGTVVQQQQQQPNHDDRTKHVKRCPHADAPDRLRLVPSLTCAACAYSVCCHCFARSDAAVLLLSKGTDSAESSSHENNSFELLLHDPQKRFNVVISHLQERFGGGGGFTAAAQQQPLRCHVCKQPHSALTYDDVAPFPWSCEGMHPIHRVSLKGGGMYAQAAVQKYYQIRSIRDAREKVPLSELSVTWMGRSIDNDNYNDSCESRAKLSQPIRSSSRDAFQDHPAGLFTTIRVGSCPFARERYRRAESQHQLLPAAAERGGDPQRCDLRRGHCVVEGSSFYVTLRNPSRGTKLLWCARSGVPRGEVLFHASDDIGHHPANNSVHHHNAPADGKTKGRGLPTSTTIISSSQMLSRSSSTVGALIPVALWSAPPTVDGVVVDTAATAAATTYSASRGGAGGGGRSSAAVASIVSIPPWVFEVTVPHGVWEETGGCGTLELYHYTSSSSHEAFHHPQKNGGSGMEGSGGGGELSTSSAQLTSAQQHGMSHVSGKQRYLDGAAFASPLLVVEVLHERVVDMSAPPNTTSRTTVSSQCPPPYPPEANFMLDALHHGRHVGVYGVGSKRAFLTHVSRSHIFSETRVHCIDIGSAGAAHRVGGVTTSGRLYDELQRVEHEIVTAQRAVSRREAALRRRCGSAATNNHASFRHQEGRLKEWKHQTDNIERAQHAVVDLTHDDCVIPVDDAEEDSSPHTTHQAVLQPLQYTQNVSCLTPMPTPSSQQHSASQRRDKNSSVMVLSPPPRFVWEESGGSSQTPTTAMVQKPRLDMYGGDENPQHSRKRAREIDDNDDDDAMNNNSGLQADLSRSYGLQRTVFSEPPHQRSFSSDVSHRESAGFDVETSVVDGRFPFVIPPALLRAAQTLSAPSTCQPLLLRPSSSESSSKTSRRLGAGGSSLKDLIVIHGIDRILQLGIGSTSSSSVATNAAGSNNKLPWIQEFSAMLQRVTSSGAPSDAGASLSAVGLIFSFDDPEFLVNVPRDFLHAARPLFVQLQSPTWLLPRTGELADAHWSAPRRATVPLLHALSAAIGNSGVTGGGAASGGGGNAAGANRRRGLPLVDTVRRVILSLPEAFRQLLQLTVKKQREAGEDVFIAVPLLLEFFLSEANLFVSQGRMRPFLQELTSNRIAVYEASRHAVMILQHHLVSQVLDDVLLKGNGGTP